MLQIKLRQLMPVLYDIFNTIVFSWVKIMHFHSCLERIPIPYSKLNFMLWYTERTEIKKYISHSIPRTSISASNR